MFCCCCCCFVVVVVVLTDTNSDIKVDRIRRNRPEEDRQTVTEIEGEVALE